MSKLLRSFAFVMVVCVLAAAGCQRQSDPPKGVVPQAKPFAGAKDDGSLAEAAYIQLGVPAPDRNWMGNDMTLAMKALVVLAEKEPEKLPRYRSERSGTVFARITSANNLDAYRDRTLPLESRAIQMIVYFQSSGDIFKLYMGANQREAALGSELIELSGSLLRSARLLMEMVQELIPTFDKNDGKYAARMAGLKKTREGMAGIVAGGLTTLTERDAFSSEERARLLGYLRETLPSIVPYLSEAAHQETLVRLEGLSKDTDLQDLRAGLVELRGSVQAALKKAKTP